VEEFTRVAERYRGELRVHCYRMLGSVEEAEDLVQETFLRAWKGIDGFAGRSSMRAWLYKIATNACLDFLDGRARRVLPDQATGAEVEWLQPFPDPVDVVVSRETIELAFLAAIQFLPPRQRAVLILRDVLGWRASETASLLDGSVASVNSALQRARETLRSRLPAHRLEWTVEARPTERELALLRRYMTAVERADLSAVAALLAEDVRATMPPYREWFQGRAEVMAALATSWDAGSELYVGRFRMLATVANGQPAAAAYVRRPGEAEFRAFAIGALRIAGDEIVELTAFHDVRLFGVFSLPTALTDEFSAEGVSQGGPHSSGGST
jgi:RNA polymerase sigma-70 factor (ECF subfamily)